MFTITEFDPDEVYGFMDSNEAAEFLGIPYTALGRSPRLSPATPSHRSGSGT